jgi:hypothetical protein
MFEKTIIFCLFSLFQYSLDNEAERQKYELQAQRIHEDMVRRLGTPNEGLEVKNSRLNGLKRVESQITELKRMEQINQLPAASTRRPQPRSANLEQLYHEAIPMHKALSHSGPSTFGNGLLQHPVSSIIDRVSPPPPFHGILK